MRDRELIKKVLGEFYVGGKQYPGNLPAELQDWYCYVSDGGHSILAVLKQHYQPDTDLTMQLVPVPVKTALKSYEVKGSYVVVDCLYSPTTGLLFDPNDEEF